MTSVDFYFNADDRLQVACRLAGKTVSQNRRLLIYTPDAELAQRLDRMLWTIPATGFVPHCRADEAVADRTPVLIAAEAVSPPGCELMLNLAQDCPPHFERFERLLEIVARDDAERLAGRSRYRFYKERGYPINDHDLGRSGARSE